MTPYVVFDTVTGEIACQSEITLVPDEETAKLQIAGLAQAWGDSYLAIPGIGEKASHYVIPLAGEYRIVPRPPVPYVIDKTTLIADGEDYVTITNLHNPCTIVLDDPDPTTETSTHTVTDGGFEFSADVPGLYTIQISQFPFLPMTLEITAT